MQFNEKIGMKVGRIANFRVFLVLGFLLAFWGAPAAQAAKLSQDLEQTLSLRGPDEEIPVIITLDGKPDIKAFQNLHKDLKRSAIVRALRDAADRNFPPLQAILQTRGGKDIRELWIIHGIAAKLRPDVIRNLSTLPGVKSIRLDHTLQAPEAPETLSVTPEWNLTSIQAPDLWDLGYMGEGVVIAAMDTGVDLNHPDLMSKYRGGMNSWYDPSGEHPEPYDASGHGTQVMGVLVGGNAGGTAIGVAPGAQWIAAKVFNDAGQAPYSVIHLGFQWLLNPDGVSGSDDAPNVVNISWGLGGVNKCETEFQPDVEALTGAGIAVVFAAGNSGPNPSTSISPGNLPGAFAVGAVNITNNIYTLSSRGPCACDGTIYPDMAAPGVGIRTSTLTYGGAFPNSYVTLSGTSFAAPHVAGAMALLLSAFPDLTVDDLEAVLKDSAFDLGDPGPDNSYGYGLLKVLAAYQLLFSPVPDIFADPSSYEFSKIKEGNFSAPKTFTVVNEGTGDLSIIDIAITGTHFNEFLKQTDGCSGQILAPSQICTLEVVFSPTSGGVKNANLSISTNDPDENPLNVALTGIGLEQYRLSVAKMGTGTGRVASISKRIDCGLDCSELYSFGQVVTLHAFADPESRFGGWSVCSSSGCNSSVGTTRLVRMNRDKNVTATFIGPSLTLTSPNGEETWRKGSYKRIKWVFTGRPGPYVKIELLQGDTVIRTIAKQVPIGCYGKGHFDWFISRKLPDGADYKIRITSTRNSAHTDASDLPFTLHH